MSEATVEVVKYDATWPAKFIAERAVLAECLQEWLVGPPEHIGSTAVPGLSAKPVIDIMAPVQSLEHSKDAIGTVVYAGYAYCPYKPDVMHWFCKPSPEHRTHHLHLVPLGSRLWNERLVFRNALRADAHLRRQYQELKMALASRHSHDREAYTEAKGPFIQGVVASLLQGDGSAA
jgi:GrpB-like predicted nucleotidyltransferase (UPF0157 family)